MSIPAPAVQGQYFRRERERSQNAHPAGHLRRGPRTTRRLIICRVGTSDGMGMRSPVSSKQRERAFRHSGRHRRNGAAPFSPPRPATDAGGIAPARLLPRSPRPSPSALGPKPRRRKVPGAIRAVALALPLGAVHAAGPGPAQCRPGHGLALGDQARHRRHLLAAAPARPGSKLRQLAVFGIAIAGRPAPQAGHRLRPHVPLLPAERQGAVPACAGGCSSGCWRCRCTPLRT